MRRLLHPKTTVRWRLTLLYGGLFLICGAGLLAVTYALVDNATIGTAVPTFVKATSAEQRVASVAAKIALGRAVAVRHGPPKQVPVPPGILKALRSASGKSAITIVGRQQRISDLHHLEVESGIALAIMTVISGLLGWLVAGRVLRPLRTITTTTQQISEENLHQRLAIPGPKDELRRLADTIDGLLERLESAFEAQRRFVANASHELRTPLTATRALLEMALSDPRATIETFRETCRGALEEGEQQEQLIDALLALAHGQRGLEAREAMDLAKVTLSVIDGQAAEAAEAGVRVDASLHTAPIAADPRLIERLVSNLVENAIRHNKPDGTVEVCVEARGRSATLLVTNTGPVVPPGEVERLLQPFQRLAPDRLAHRSGHGLGLSIVAAIASSHDAELGLEPGTHGGLRVEVRFPAYSRAAIASATAVAPAVPISSV